MSSFFMKVGRLVNRRSSRAMTTQISFTRQIPTPNPSGGRKMACSIGLLVGGGCLLSWWSSSSTFEFDPKAKVNVDEEKAKNDALPKIEHPILKAPEVPPPIERDYPARVCVAITSDNKLIQLSPQHKYPVWTFNGGVPGPFIRARVGDLLEVSYTNNDPDGNAHNIDFHAVTGPGGGAPALLCEKGQTKVGEFKLLNPGLFIYHCASAPVPVHIQNGMYGLILVEPPRGLPKVDKEFYLLQSEWYGEENPETPGVLEPSFLKGLEEHPIYVTLNGRVGAHTEKPLMAKTGDTVRFFVGNAGPNLVSSFHIIGTIFDKTWREGDIVSPPARHLQTTLIPSGGATMIELNTPVPGTFTLLDHSIFRLEKGCVGFLKVLGDPRPDIYDSHDKLEYCPGCKLHN